MITDPRTGEILAHDLGGGRVERRPFGRQRERMNRVPRSSPSRRRALLVSRDRVRSPTPSTPATGHGRCTNGRWITRRRWRRLADTPRSDQGVVERRHRQVREPHVSRAGSSTRAFVTSGSGRLTGSPPSRRGLRECSAGPSSGACSRTESLVVRLRAFGHARCRWRWPSERLPTTGWLMEPHPRSGGAPTTTETPSRLGQTAARCGSAVPARGRRGADVGSGGRG